MSLHVPTITARVVVVDPEIQPVEGEPEPRLRPGMEVRSVGLPSPTTRGILEGMCLTRGDGAEVWTAVHRQLLGSWDASLRPPGHDRLVAVEWRLRAASGPCPSVVMWPQRSGLGPRWETILVLWDWVTIRWVGGHAFTASRGTAEDSDGRLDHYVMVSPQWGAESPQPWRDPIGRFFWWDLPALRATMSGPLITRCRK